jgi:hypothetical protein
MPERIASSARTPDPESVRLLEDANRTRNWKRWGPYLAERQWGTVREDYSAGGAAWVYFPHDHARSRAYRWGEDGLLGITDRECRLCFSLALWNERDPILKERLFGLAGTEGNHGEDVKECYYYLDATPTSSYLKALYKYPQAEYPYARLVTENRKRGAAIPSSSCAIPARVRREPLLRRHRRYARFAPDDMLIQSRSRSAPRPLIHAAHVAVPQHVVVGPAARVTGRNRDRTRGRVEARSPRMPRSGACGSPVGPDPDGRPPTILFTDNETNQSRLFGAKNGDACVKDAFHDFVIRGERGAVAAQARGTKAAAHYTLAIPAGGEVTLRLRLDAPGEPSAPAGTPYDRLGAAFDAIVAARIADADAFYAGRIPEGLTPEERDVSRQSYAGLLWSKQFFHYVVKDWLEGDPAQPAPAAPRWEGRNAEWTHLYNRDVISMPDTWE